MPKDKISSNKAIDAALQLDGDPEKVRAYYDDWAHNYDHDTGSVEYSAPTVSARLLREHLPDDAACLLDAGCGTGLTGVELRRLGYRDIDGFDLSESMVQLALSTGAYRKLAGGIDMMQAELHYAAGSYDAVLAVGVFTLGHVPPEALTVLLQLVRPGGLLLLSTRTHYYEKTGFQSLVEHKLEEGKVELLKVLRDAPYNRDGDAHYWLFRKSG